MAAAPEQIELWATYSSLQGAVTRCARFGRRGGCIGRAADNDLVLDDPERGISRVQAFVSWSEDGFRIRRVGLAAMDINVFVLGDGDELPLEVGDRLRIGPWTIQVQAPSAFDSPSDLPDPAGSSSAPRPTAGRPPRVEVTALRNKDEVSAFLRPREPGPAPAPAPCLQPDPLDDWLSGDHTPSSVDAFAPCWFDAASNPQPPAPDPICFAVTAPPRFEPGRAFTAALAIHVESLRERVAAQLARLGGPDAVPLMDLPPMRQSGWRVGAPVTVQLQVDGAESPPPVELEWSGRSSLAVFQLRPADPPPQRIELVFHVQLAGVPMGLVPLTVEGPAGETAPTVPLPRRAPSTAFASYASADAQEVGLCLSALSRWAPALSIFQDCLDLLPDEDYKPQLERRIRDSDAFLLFWSRQAARSPWVRWEFDVARTGKGLDAVIPMPLEDPALAPPPPELAQRHWRDRYMLARAGLAQAAAREGARAAHPSADG